MGWASLLADSVKNPFTSFLGENANAIRGAGVGIASGTDFNTGLSNAAQYAAQGAQKDDAFATQKKEEAKRQEQLQKAVDNYRNAGMADIADWLSTTGPDGLDLAAQQFWKRKEPGYGQAAPTPMEFRDVNGDIIGLDPYAGTSQVVYDGPDAAATGDSYTLGPGQVRYGANNQVVATGPTKPSGSMDSTTKKELFEAADAVTAGDYVLSALDEALKLNDKAFDGPTADIRGDGMALFGNEEGVATSRLKNVTTELALSQLKTVFGSMPTEGERKILLELQGSVNQPRLVRDAIFKRAKTMAERRIEDNKRKAEALRSGEYFGPGYDGGGAAPANVDDILTKYGL